MCLLMRIAMWKEIVRKHSNKVLLVKRMKKMAMQVYETRFVFINFSVQQNVLFSAIGLIKLTKI